MSCDVLGGGESYDSYIWVFVTCEGGEDGPKKEQFAYIMGCGFLMMWRD